MNSTELEYVGFWPRFGAQLIDTIIVLLVTTPLLALMPIGDPNMDLDQLLSADPADLSLTSILPGWPHLLISLVLPAVAVIWLWRGKEATPGKMAVGARVVDAKTGNAITTMQGIVRWLGYWVSMLPLCLGFLWVAIDARKQGWHDKMAGTVVVRAKNRGTQPVKFESH